MQEKVTDRQLEREFGSFGLKLLCFFSFDDNFKNKEICRYVDFLSLHAFFVQDFTMRECVIESPGNYGDPLFTSWEVIASARKD
jgi:hypothetical protein